MAKLTAVLILLLATVQSVQVVETGRDAVQDFAGLGADTMAFVEWAIAGGIQFQDRFEIKHVEGMGLGIFSKKGLRPGELLISVPRKLLLTPETASSSFVGQIFSNEGLKGCSQPLSSAQEDCMALLAMHLLYARSDPSSFWYPWLRILPKALGSPIFWTEDEFEELQGSNLEGIAEGWREQIKSLFKQVVVPLRQKYPAELPKDLFSLKNFQWAYMTVFGRAFDIKLPPLASPSPASSSSRQRIMAPLVDLFNHGNVNSTYQFNSFKSEFELFTQQTYQPGDEVLLNYDPKNNADLLMQYGFVIEESEHDYVGVVASIGTDAANYKQKSMLLKHLGFNMGHSHHLYITGLSNASTDCIRVLCASEEEVASGAVKRVLRREKISAANEECLCKTMVAAIEALLDKYPTRVYEDDAMLKRGGLSPNRRNALILRRDEKRILIYNLSRYQRLLNKLRQAEEL